MSFEQEDQIPPLIPLKKKKAQMVAVATPSQKNSVNGDDLKNKYEISKDNTPTNQISKDNDKSQFFAKKLPNPSKIQQIEKKAKQKISTVHKKGNQTQSEENDRSKLLQKMKKDISQHLNKMAVKNLSQELYPVSNQAIHQLLAKIQQQIQELHHEAEKKESTLALNQNNLHLKKQLETIQRQIDHCYLIKQLYYQKINYRNKIITLQEMIQNFRRQNQDLDRKVKKGSEIIENYKKNLPVDNEKQLKEKLNQCMNQLAQEKEMRQSLQKNIESIINNFKRLYDEADIARQIVTKKLKDIEDRQRRLKRMKEKEQQDQSEQVAPSPIRRVTSIEHEKDKATNSHADLNSSQFNPSTFRKHADQDYKKTAIKTPIGSTTKQQKQKKPQNLTTSLSLQQKIKKMRSNQMTINRAYQN